ncbi:Peroxidase [Mycena indigotica]|uniref:Peroxidase n=1 Tax=Mycena indigotica TaxID=2126181 RepID=A0A8H6T6D4_9AGAR|nr:Peroxidase [Mycena indigotica]KAF7312613.1 Peroxidase [Mycena indigotica]
MHRILTFVLALALLILPILATPSRLRLPGSALRLARKHGGGETGDDDDGPGGDNDNDDDSNADGNIPDLGDSAGIPDVANATNAACVPFYPVRDAILGGVFGGRCTDLARASVRLAFHDAGTFSLRLAALGKPNGAADGSLLWDPQEVLRDENNGLQDIVAALAPLPQRFNVSPGDVLQLAGVLGVLACPGGPRIDAWVGRPLPANKAPNGLLPSPNDSVDSLLGRFADMGFAPVDLIALIGAHGTARQRFVDPAMAGEAMDTTIDLWDVNFYRDTNVATAPHNVFRLASDVNLAHNASTKAFFHEYIDNQPDWDQDYRAAHLLMSTLGYKTTELVNCTELMPASINLTRVSMPDTVSGKAVVDPGLLEAAIQKYRAPWLKP